MDEGEKKRVEELERKVERLEGSLASSETPVLGLAAFAVFVLYIVIVMNFPFEAEIEGGERFAIGLACYLMAVAIMISAMGFTKFALKAIVEVLAVLGGLVNAVYCVWVYENFFLFRQWIAVATPIDFADAGFAAFALAAILLFISDVLILATLYPTAKAVGSNVFD